MHNQVFKYLKRVEEKIIICLGLPICFSMSAASSGVALGITPGSEKDVRKSVANTKVNRRPPTTGIAGVILTAKKGQLWKVGNETNLEISKPF